MFDVLLLTSPLPIPVNRCDHRHRNTSYCKTNRGKNASQTVMNEWEEIERGRRCRKCWVPHAFRATRNESRNSYLRDKSFPKCLLHHRFRNLPALENLHHDECNVCDSTEVLRSLPLFHHNSLAFKELCCRCNSCVRPSHHHPTFSSDYSFEYSQSPLVYPPIRTINSLRFVLYSPCRLRRVVGNEIALLEMRGTFRKEENRDPPFKVSST